MMTVAAQIAEQKALLKALEGAVEAQRVVVDRHRAQLDAFDDLLATLPRASRRKVPRSGRRRTLRLHAEERKLLKELEADVAEALAQLEELDAA
jgi:uncharacterized coiled-coil protein SlyX